MVPGEGEGEGNWGTVLKMDRNMKMWPRVKCKQHEAVCQLAAIQKQQEVLGRSLCLSPLLLLSLELRKDSAGFVLLALRVLICSTV